MRIPLSNRTICKDLSAHSASVAGFSLIELLITLAIILLLTGLYWNSNSGGRQRALQNSCQNNLTKIYVGMTLFGNDHAGRFPNVTKARTSEQALDLLVPAYCSDTSVFICPGSKDQVLPGGQSLTKGKISYAYYMGRGPANATRALASDAQVDTQSKAAGEPVFSSDGKPPGNNHGKFGGNLLFCDGHVELSSPRAAFTLGFGPGETLLNP
jgi:prepilin-type N-terminal cleavage/methylation domain-containing protein/prepilin-type processing-associated H-X9-DG protein